MTDLTDRQLDRWIEWTKDAKQYGDHVESGAAEELEAIFLEVRRWREHECYRTWSEAYLAQRRKEKGSVASLDAADAPGMRLYQLVPGPIGFADGSEQAGDE